MLAWPEPAAVYPPTDDTKGGWTEEADCGLPASLILIPEAWRSGLGAFQKRKILRSVQKQPTVEKESAQAWVNVVFLLWACAEEEVFCFSPSVYFGLIFFSLRFILFYSSMFAKQFDTYIWQTQNLPLEPFLHTQFRGSEYIRTVVHVSSLTIFDWNILALQCCVSSYCRAKCVGYMSIYTPSFLDFLPV